MESSTGRTEDPRDEGEWAWTIKDVTTKKGKSEQQLNHLLIASLFAPIEGKVNCFRANREEGGTRRRRPSREEKK